MRAIFESAGSKGNTNWQDLSKTTASTACYHRPQYIDTARHSSRGTGIGTGVYAGIGPELVNRGVALTIENTPHSRKLSKQAAWAP